jgi:hypothetical protein
LILRYPCLVKQSLRFPTGLLTQMLSSMNASLKWPHFREERR